MARKKNSRLEEFIAALELLMLLFDCLYAIHYREQTRLQHLRLSINAFISIYVTFLYLLEA